MSKDITFTRASLPEFGLLVSEKIYKEADISLGILKNSIPCGLVCANFKNYQYVISWIYIDKDQRKKGYGKALLEEFTRLIRKAGEIYPITISFSSTYDELLGLFNSLEHFYVTVEGSIYYILPGDVNKSDLYKKLATSNEKSCKSYYQFQDACKDNFLKKLKNKYPQYFRLVNEYLDIFLPDLSLAWGEKEILAAVFTRKIGKKELDISFMYSEDVLGCGLVLVGLIKNIDKKYKDYSIRIITTSLEAKAMVEKIFKDYKEEYLLQANWDFRLPGEYPAFN